MLQIPFGGSSDNSLRIMESILQHNESINKKEKDKWKAMTPEEKTRFYELPLLKMGLKQCSNCRAIARPWESLADGFGFEPVIFCFDEKTKTESLKQNSLPQCENHNNDARKMLMDLRFCSFDKLREFWNSLLNR